MNIFPYIHSQRHGFEKSIDETFETEIIKKIVLRYQILRPLFGQRGPKRSIEEEKDNKAISSSSFSLSPSNSFLDLPPNCSREHQFLVKLRESKAVEILSYLSYRDRGSIYTIPVFLSYLPTHRRLLLLVVERSRSLDEGRRQAHDKEREKMVEGDGKGARDLRTRVTERDRRVSLAGDKQGF